MIQPDGTVVCDRCGGDVGNGGIAEAVVLTYMDVDGNAVQAHWCLHNDEERQRCGARILTKASLAKSRPDKVDLYQPPDPPAAPP